MSEQIKEILVAFFEYLKTVFAHWYPELAEKFEDEEVEA